MKTLLAKFAIALLAVNGIQAQTATRQVVVTWTASPSTGVLGYNVYRIVASGVPTLLTPTPTTALTFTDPAVTVGQTYTYQVTAAAAPCTPTTPVGQPCGESAPSTASTTVPPKPTVTATITVVVP